MTLHVLWNVLKRDFERDADGAPITTEDVRSLPHSGHVHALEVEDTDLDVGFGHVFNPAVNVRGKPEIKWVEPGRAIRVFPILRKAAR